MTVSVYCIQCRKDTRQFMFPLFEMRECRTCHAFVSTQIYWPRASRGSVGQSFVAAPGHVVWYMGRQWLLWSGNNE